MAINLLNELTKKKLFNIMIKLFEKTHDASANFKIQYGALFGLASRANGDRGGVPLTADEKSAEPKASLWSNLKLNNYMHR